MNIDQSFLTIITSLITGGAVWFLVKPNSQKLAGDAYASLSNSINILSKRVDELEREKQKIYDDLDRERLARETDHIASDAKIVKLEVSVHTERSARGILESQLIDAKQRISALEDERDLYQAENLKQAARIKELESGTYSATKSGD